MKENEMSATITITNNKHYLQIDEIDDDRCYL